MGPYGTIWSRMEPYGLVWSLMVQYGPICGPIWSLMVPYGPIWSLIVPYGPVWSCVVPCGPIWSHLLPYGPIWSRMVPYGPVRSHKVPYGPVWSGFFLISPAELHMTLQDPIFFLMLHMFTFCTNFVLLNTHFFTVNHGHSMIFSRIFIKRNVDIISTLFTSLHASFFLLSLQGDLQGV